MSKQELTDNCHVFSIYIDLKMVNEIHIRINKYNRYITLYENGFWMIGTGIKIYQFTKNYDAISWKNNLDSVPNTKTVFSFTEHMIRPL